MSHELKPLESRLIVVPSREISWERFGDILNRYAWNMYRSQTKHMLTQLQREITRTGGERQRNEGFKILERVKRRLSEWVE